MKTSLRPAVLVLAALLLASSASDVLAQGYPSKAIRFVVPYPPGGANDILARTIGQKLTEAWGQAVIVDNKPGAGTRIGTEMVAKAAPDGYTILIQANTMTINPSLYRDLPYDAVRDFAPVSLLASVPLILVVNPSVPATTLKELIAVAKAKPGQLNYASVGSGSALNLAAELFKIVAGVDIVHIPYKGSVPALTAVLSGQVSMMFVDTPPALPHIKAGKLRALAVTPARRSPVAPDVPTVAEAGLPGYDVTAWFGLVVPAATPREVITKLNLEVVKILRMPDVKDRLASLGLEPVGSTPAEFGAHIKSEIDKWAKVIRSAGIRVD